MINLDKKNKILIENLINNARIPLTKIAKKINLSKSSTSNRLNNLIKKEIIMGFSLIIDFIKIGYSINFIFLKVYLSKEILLKLENLDFCLGYSNTSSFFNLNLTLLSKNLDEFRKQLSLIYQITNYYEIKSFRILDYETPQLNLFEINIKKKKKIIFFNFNFFKL